MTELRIDPSHVLISWGEVSHNLPKEIGRNIISLCNSKGLDIKYQNMLQLLLPYFRTPEDHFFILVLLISRLTNTFGGPHRCETMNRYFKIKSAFPDLFFRKGQTPIKWIIELSFKIQRFKEKHIFVKNYNCLQKILRSAHLLKIVTIKR